MNNINYDYIEKYIKNTVEERDDDLKIIEEYARLNKVPIIDKEVGQLIKFILKVKKPKKILEIGTAIGYSSIFMMKNLDQNATITTIEKFEKPYNIAKNNIALNGYEKNINLILGDAGEVLRSIEDTYDLVFIDAAKGQYIDYFDKIKDNLNPGGIIISDNILFKGMVATDDLVKKRKITIVKRLREYIKYITSIEGYTTSVVPLGDGVALTYKEDLNEK